VCQTVNHIDSVYLTCFLLVFHNLYILITIHLYQEFKMLPCSENYLTFDWLVDLGHNNDEKEVWWERLLLCSHCDHGLLIVHSIPGNPNVLTIFPVLFSITGLHTAWLSSNGKACLGEWRTNFSNCQYCIYKPHTIYLVYMLGWN
jgi:hypothetical protein